MNILKTEDGRLSNYKHIKSKFKSEIEPLLTEGGENQIKVDLILAINGLKKATNFYFLYHKDDAEETINKNIQKVENFFKIAGLKFVNNGFIELRKGHRLKEYITGKDYKNVLYLQELWNKGEDFGERAIEMGKIFGFPKTAIDAYVHRDKILEEKDFPKEIINQDYMAFALFKFSKNNYLKELETVKKWANIVKNFSPVFYRKVIKDYQENSPK